MYCNCKDISSFWDHQTERIFPILQDLYIGLRKSEIPMIEVIKNESALHGLTNPEDKNQIKGKDIYFIQIASCLCKKRPLIRISEKCLLLEIDSLSRVIENAVKKLKADETGEFTVNLSTNELNNL